MAAKQRQKRNVASARVHQSVDGVARSRRNVDHRTPVTVTGTKADDGAEGEAD